MRYLPTNNQSLVAAKIGFSTDPLHPHPSSHFLSLAQANLETYLKKIKNSGGAEATVRNYRSDISQFLEFCKVQGIDPSEQKTAVEKFVAFQREKDLKEASIRRKTVSISTYLDWVQGLGSQATTPVGSTGLVGSVGSRGPLFSPEEGSTLAGLRPATATASSIQTQPPSPSLNLNQSQHPLPAPSDKEAFLIPLEIEKLLNQYLTTLKYNTISETTIRNYRSDIKQFALFTKAATIDQLLRFDLLKQFALVQKQKGLKPSSIQRKLVSITQFALWVQRRKRISGVTPDWASLAIDSVFNADDGPVVVVTPPPETPPLVATTPNKKRKRESLLAGLILLLLLFGSTIGLFLVQTVQDIRQQAATNTPIPTPIQEIPPPLVTPTPAGHTLPFRGRLYSKETGNQITGTVNSSFRLLSSLDENAPSLWESGSCEISSNNEGIFEILLGGTNISNGCGGPLTDEIYFGSPNLWVSSTINGEQLELYPLKIVEYSKNSDLLAGFALGDPVVKESVLFMNEYGEILFADEPLFSVPQGDIRLSGNNLYFTTEGRGGAIFDSVIKAPLAFLGGPGQDASALTLQSSPGQTQPLMVWQDPTGKALGVIDTSGNIGIGTTTPKGQLSLGQNYITSSGADLLFYDARTGTLTSLSQLKVDQVGTNFWNQSGTDISYTSGKVGIGTTTPEELLHVAGNLQLGTADGDRYIYFDNGTSNNSGIRYNSSSDKIQFSHDGSNWSDLGTGGGGTAGVTKVSNSDGTLTISPTSGEVVVSLNLNKANNWTAQQNFAGNVGIGTTSPGFRLDVQGTGVVARFNGRVIGAEAVNNNEFVTLSQLDGLALPSGTGPGQTLYYDGSSWVPTSNFFNNGTSVGINSIGAGTTDSVITREASGALTARSIDSRVWGSSLVDGSGSTNFLTKWLDANTVSTSVLFDNGTNIGIGTTSPAARLSFVASTSASGGIDFGGDTSLYRSAAGVLSTNGNLMVNGGTIGIGSTGEIYLASANVLRTPDSLTVDGTLNVGTVGTGTTDSVITRESSGDLSARSIDSRVWGSSLVDGSGTTNYVAFWSDPNTLSSEQFLSTSRGGLGANVTPTTAGELLYSSSTSTYSSLAAGSSGQLLTSGGSSSPSWSNIASLLTAGDDISISGTTNATISLQDDIDLSSIRASSSSGLSLLDDSGTLGLFLQDSSGNIGIGTSSPEQKLSVDGNIQLGSSNATRYIYFDNGTSDNAGIRYDSSTAKVQVSHDGVTWDSIGEVTGVSSVANADGTLTISPSTGDVLASLNLNNANTWLAAQTFSADTFFPNSSTWSAAGNIGLGTTSPGARLSFAASTSAAGGINFGGDTSLYRSAVSTLSTNGDLMVSGGNIGIGASGEIYLAASNILRTPDSLTVDGTLNVGTVGTGTTNSVITRESSGDLSARSIDSRVWGSSLVDGSGTTNFLTKWLDANTISTSVLFDDGTNVGIGTTSPGARLSFAAGTTAADGISFGGDTNLYRAGAGLLQTDHSLTVDGTLNLGTVGTGTTDSVITRESSGDLSARSIDSRVWGSSLVDGSGTTNYVAFWSDPNTLSSEQFLSTSRGGLGNNVTPTTAGELLYSSSTSAYSSLAAGSSGQLLTSGGSSSPSWSNIASLLTAGDDISISGTTNATISLQDDISLTSLSASSAAGLSFLDDGGVLGIFLEDASGNIGIGTASPEEKLTVDGNLQLGITDGDRYIYFDNGTANNSGIRYNSTTNVLEFSNNGMAWNEFGTATGGVISVSNTDGTLTISPTTGDVIASLNLSNANTWLAAQTFSADTFFPNSGVWDSAGNIGIGTSTTNAALSFAASTSAAGGIDFGGDTSFYRSAAGVLSTNGDLMIAGGNVGIGSTGEIYLAAANVLRTPDSLTVDGTLNVGTVGLGITDSVITRQSGGDLAARSIDSRVWGSSLVDGSGSTNFLTKWLDANTVSTSVLFDNGTNIGIGTTSPAARLSFVASTSASGGIDFGGDTSLYRSAAGVLSTNGNLMVNGGTIGIGSTGEIYLASANVLRTPDSLTVDGTLNVGTVGSGTTDSVITRESSGDLSARSIDSRVWGSSLVDGSGTTNYVAFWSDPNTLSSEQFLSTSRGGLGNNVTPTTAGELLYSSSTSAYSSLAAGSSGQLLTSGGSSSPSWSNIASLLTAGDDIFISGTTNATISLQDDIDLSSIRASSSSGLSLLDDSGTLGLFLQDSSGNIGIGTSSPEQKLSVDGNIQLGSSNATRYIYFDNGTSDNAGIRYDSSTAKVQVSHDGTTWDDIGSGGGGSVWLQNGSDIYYNTGNVGIGTSTPERSFNTTGDIQLGTTDGTRYIYFDNGTNYNAGIRYNSSSDMLQYSHDGLSWYDFGTSGSSKFFTNTGSVAAGSYLDVTHNQATFNVVASAWVNNGTNWVEIDDLGRVSHNIYDPTLISWYKMEEASGNLDNAEGTSSRDLIPKGSPSYSQQGAINNALAFNGSNAFFCSGSGSTCADNNDFDFGSGSFSVGGWFKHGSISTNPDYIVSKYAASASADTGTGTDGSISLTSGVHGATPNINTTNFISGRSCSDGGDAVNYSVSSLSSSSATLFSSPATGCLSPGDELLLINLQGTSSYTDNVGNYEFLRVASVSGTTVTFTTPKLKFYGSAAASDAGLGTTDSTQRVMLQRVPNYTNVTIASGVTLIPATYNGTKGGVVAFRATGSVSVAGGVSAAARGYAGGASAGAVSGTYGFQGSSTTGHATTQNRTSFSEGGGGGGYNSTGGGGGSHATTCQAPLFVDTVSK